MVRKLNKSHCTSTCNIFLLILVKLTLTKCLDLMQLPFEASTKYTVHQKRPPTTSKKCKVCQYSALDCTVTDADVHQLSEHGSNVQCMLNKKTMYTFTAHSTHCYNLYDPVSSHSIIAKFGNFIRSTWPANSS